ncbi:MAG: carboxypeptidase-like regulatory domain-containing protein, partial [Terracidiphilus sp.]
ARARGPLDSITEAGAAATDDTGAYEFGNLDAGEYALAVTAEPWYALHRSAGSSSQRSEGEAANQRNAALDVAYPVTYYDSTTDESAATPIVLAGGSREEANISLHAVPALRLSIAVPRKQGGGIARPELRRTIFGTEVSARSAGFLDALQTGTVEMTGVAPGHYVLLQGDPPRIANLDATVSQQVDATAGAPAVAVTGTLRAAPGQTLPEEANVFLYLMDSPLHLSPLEERALTGQFHFDNVPPGEWELSAWSAGQAMATLSVSANGREHAGGAFTVGDRPLAIRATVTLGETRIAGFARRNGKGLAGALVVLAPRNLAAFDGLVRRDQSDSDGSFSLLHVAPGEYTLVAIESAWDLVRAGPEALARYLPQGTAVTVTDRSGALLRLAEPITVQPR